MPSPISTITSNSPSTKLIRKMGYLKTLKSSNSYFSFPSSKFDLRFTLFGGNPQKTISRKLNQSHFGCGHRSFSSNHHQILRDLEINSMAKKNGIDLRQYPPEKIRNFSIIAHIDHGKSTLADRLLELTGTIQRGHNHPQYLDKLQVERERGITVKAQTASMFHRYNIQRPGVNYAQESVLLNLIDTPGHVDFSYEVSRSLAACQGVLLVVDAAQGVQAQTIANYYLALDAKLTIIPVINKIDLPTADPDRVNDQLESMFALDQSEALLASAKMGQGLEQILHAIIERIPPPRGKSGSPLRMLLFDSYYDEYRKVICHVAVVDGVLRKGEKIVSAATGQSYQVSDVGIMHPELKPTGILLTGQVGYVVCGMSSTEEARAGDTLYHRRTTVEPLPGFKPAKHMVFSGLYPASGTDVDALKHAVEKLTCNDSSVSVAKENDAALGRGFRCGFLGLLHMDVFHQRLEQEYGVHVYNTIPTVPYIFEFSDSSKVEVQNPAAFPSNKKQVTACWEPTVIAKIIIPSEFVGPVITLCSERRGEQLEYSFINSQRALLKYCIPLRELIVDFYDILKSITSGYASFDYEESEYQTSNLVKLDALLNGEPVDALATIVHKLKAPRVGRDIVEMLKKFVDRSQMNEITIQDVIGSKIIVKETIPALKKYVVGKHGGAVTGKKKPIEKQKDGNKFSDKQKAGKKMKHGSIDIPQEAFVELFKCS